MSVEQLIGGRKRGNWGRKGISPTAVAPCHLWAYTKLQQVAGVGPLTSLVFVLTIGDPNRFAKARQIGPFLGLVPKRDQSGDSDKALLITKADGHQLRRLLVAAAHYALSKNSSDCALKRAGLKRAGSGGDVASTARILTTCTMKPDCRPRKQAKVVVPPKHTSASTDTHEPKCQKQSKSP